MNRTDIRKNNLLLIINALKENKKSLDDLTKELKISMVTAINLTKILVDKKLIVVETDSEKKQDDQQIITESKINATPCFSSKQIKALDVFQ